MPANKGSLGSCYLPLWPAHLRVVALALASVYSCLFICVSFNENRRSLIDPETPPQSSRSGLFTAADQSIGEL